MRATMPYVPKSQRGKGEEGPETPREGQDLVAGLVSVVAAEAMATAATCDVLQAPSKEAQRGEQEEARATSSFSLPTAVLPPTPREEPVAWAPHCLGLQSACLPCTGLAPSCLGPQSVCLPPTGLAPSCLGPQSACLSRTGLAPSCLGPQSACLSRTGLAPSCLGPQSACLPRTGLAPSCLGPQSACLPRTGLVCAPWNQVNQGTRSFVAIPRLFPWADRVDPKSLLEDGLALVPFLLRKYHLKEPTSRGELLNLVSREHQEFFPMIFKTACECMLLVFGIELKEVAPGEDAYVLATSLGLTYDGLLRDVQGVPKTGFLIMVLCIVFREGNHVSDEVLWEALSKMGVCPGREHYTYGDPRKLVEDFVQEQYLEYRQVPNSDPARYVYQWGPRALAETSKMKVLEQWVNFSGRDPSSFSSLYKEALRKEREATQQ